MSSHRYKKGERKMLKESALGILTLFIIWTTGARGQESTVPIDVHVPILLKVLTFDRNLKARTGAEIVIGIAYQSDYRTSLTTQEDVMRAMGDHSNPRIEETPLRLVPIDIDESDLGGTLTREKVDILYFAPLRNVSIRQITTVARSKHVATMTGVSKYVESGVAFGVGMKSGKPLILINRTSQILEGIDFSSQLLKLARIIDG
jgi:hypothetical protein